jgi:hypothetical protein
VVAKRCGHRPGKVTSQIAVPSTATANTADLRLSANCAEGRDGGSHSCSSGRSHGSELPHHGPHGRLRQRGYDREEIFTNTQAQTRYTDSAHIETSFHSHSLFSLFFHSHSHVLIVCRHAGRDRSRASIRGSGSGCAIPRGADRALTVRDLLCRVPEYARYIIHKVSLSLSLRVCVSIPFHSCACSCAAYHNVRGG